MKFSIITPVYNGEKYIAETIESVLSQEGDFEIDYIIQDGGSNDKTIEIIKKYADQIKDKSYPIKCNGVSLQWISEKDTGMYDAITKGFKRATGTIYAYINADDIYLPEAFASVSTIFNTYSDIQWVKGISILGDEQGEIRSHGTGYIYRQEWLIQGIYGRSAPFVHQEATFWRKSVWDKTSPQISSFRLAGDYALWITFAKYTKLWSFNKQVSIFRRRQGQLSSAEENYRAEQEKIAPHNFLLEKRAMLFFSIRRLLNLNPQGAMARILFFIIFPLHGQQWYIDFDKQKIPVKKLAKSYAI